MDLNIGYMLKGYLPVYLLPEGLVYMRLFVKLAKLARLAKILQITTICFLENEKRMRKHLGSLTDLQVQKKDK